jgi:O-antigen ligase
MIFLSNRSISTEEYSWGTRLDAWKIVLEIAKVNPILGLGFSNYYWYTPLFAIRGWFISFNSHSQFVDLIAQTGILGLGCFLWLFWENGRLAWRLRGKVSDGFAQAYVHGILAGLVGTLVAAALVDWVLPFVYNIGFRGFRASILPWVFLGGLVGLEQIIRRQEQSPQVLPAGAEGG